MTYIPKGPVILGTLFGVQGESTLVYTLNAGPKELQLST